MTVVSGGDAIYFPTADDLRRPVIDAAAGNPPAITVIDAAQTPRTGQRLVRPAQSRCLLGHMRKRRYGRFWHLAVPAREDAPDWRGRSGQDMTGAQP